MALFKGMESIMALIKTWIARHASDVALLFAGILLPLALFGMLAEDVAEGKTIGFDRPILDYAHARSSSFLDALMVGATHAGSALFLMPLDLLLLVWLLKRGRRWDALLWSATVIGAALINWLAKTMFARARPSLWISRIHEITYGFPSGHAMSTMAAFTALCVLAWPTRWRWFVLGIGGAFVLVVGASRVYLGVHYPSDILAGWAASLAWVAGLVGLIRYRRDARMAAGMQRST
jgi:membrane-associated phospholipid phosphatase